MTEKQKEQWSHAAVAVVLILLIMWALFHAFRGKGQTSGSTSLNPTPDIIAPLATQKFPDFSAKGAFAPPSSHKDGCGCSSPCGGGCPVSANTIQSVNQMLSIGAAYTDAINAAGNSTMQAIADIGMQSDPLLNITVG
jgi:hypothetical protein